jgi:hypothetical protein
MFFFRQLPAQGLPQLKWIVRNVKDPSGPLHNWSERLVEKAVGKLRDQGALAEVVDDCPYTLLTLRPWFIDTVLADLVPCLKTKAFGLVGRAGCGKSPVLEAVACMLSRFWARQLRIPNATAIYRTTCDFDFFRGEVGVRDRPDILDDADPKVVTLAKWKAFTDVALKEAMSRERWGASKWVRNQMRGYAFNPCYFSGEPARGDVVSHAQFMAMLEPLWHKDMDEESKLAVCKRSALVVASKLFLYWRPATEEEVDVKRVRLRSDATDGFKDLVDCSAKPLVDSWKKGNTQLPEDHEEQLAWEESWMNAAMSDGALPIPRRRPTPATNDAPVGRITIPDRAPQAPTIPAVKTKVAIGVQAIGVLAIGVQAMGVQAIGVQAIGVQAIGVQVIGVQATAFVRVFLLLIMNCYASPEMMRRSSLHKSGNRCRSLGPPGGHN